MRTVPIYVYVYMYIHTYIGCIHKSLSTYIYIYILKMGEILRLNSNLDQERQLVTAARYAKFIESTEGCTNDSPATSAIMLVDSR